MLDEEALRQKLKAERRQARKLAREATQGGTFSGESQSEEEEEVVTMPPKVQYAAADGTDPDGIFKETAGLKVEWEPQDVEFFFSQLEMLMQSAGVLSQWTKRVICQRQLPRSVYSELKDILRKDQAAAGATPYLTLKERILDLFGKKPEEAFELASQLVLTGRPSLLCQQIIELLCKCDKPLTKCCAEGTVSALWKRRLHPQVRAAIAGRSLSKDLDGVLKHADDVHASLNQSTASPVAAVSQAMANLDTSADAPALQIAAFKPKPKKPVGTGKDAKGKKKGRGDRHEDGPPEEACSMHWQWGRSAYFCKRPKGDNACPWRDHTIAPPPKK